MEVENHEHSIEEKLFSEGQRPQGRKEYGIFKKLSKSYCSWRTESRMRVSIKKSQEEGDQRILNNCYSY